MSRLYSQAMGTKEFTITSGQLAVNEKGELVGENDIKAQTACVMGNIVKVLKDAGFEKKNIVSLTIHLSNIERDFDEYNKAYAEFFEGFAPSRITIQSTLYQPQYLIEVQATAHAEVENRA